MNTFKRFRKRFTEDGARQNDGSSRRDGGAAERQDETSRRSAAGSRQVQNHHPSAAEAHQNRQQHQDSEPPAPPRQLALHAPNAFRDPFQQLPPTISANILLKLSFKRRTQLESVCRRWRELCLMAARSEDKPVWVYVIFRKNHCSGHEKMTVNISFDGPIFWNRQVAYIYCCSCHFHEHEGPLMALLRKFEHRVERVCIVDKPVDYSFLPDSFFSYMAKNMPRLQFIYLRELDLEKINRGTVVELAQHTALKKVIVHGCRNYEVLQDFKNLPQLLVVKGEIVGLKAMIGELDFDEPESVSEMISSSNREKSKTISSSESTSEEPLSSNSKESSTSQLTAIEIGIQNVEVTD